MEKLSEIISACLPYEEPQAVTAEPLIDETSGNARAHGGPKLFRPQAIKMNLLHETPRREVARGHGITNAEPEQVVLKTTGLTRKERTSLNRALVKKEIHVGVAGPR